MKLPKHLQKVCFALLATAGLIACSEKVDTSARYVFKYDTAKSYLARHEAYATYASNSGFPEDTAASA